MAYVYMQYAQYVLQLSTGGRFQLISNFMELHALTSYALLHEITISQYQRIFNLQIKI